MPSSYTQLLVVNMLLAVLLSTTVMDAPVLPALAGAIGAGALLYARRKRKDRSLPSTAPLQPVARARLRLGAHRDVAGGASTWMRIRR
jgi:hypothetical protein